MKRRTNILEYFFGVVVLLTFVAGLASVGAIQANLEFGASLRNAAKDECMQLEGALEAIEREQEGIGCFSEGPPEGCDALWEKQEEYSREEEECYGRLASEREAGEGECGQMYGVLEDIEREKEALGCAGEEAPAECDALAQKFEEHSRAAEECRRKRDAEQEALAADCSRMGGARESIEGEAGAMGCFDAGVPEECSTLRQKKEEVEREVRVCFERMESRYGDGREEGHSVGEDVPPFGERGFSGEERDCSDLERRMERVRGEKHEICASGKHPEKCRFMEEELRQLSEKVSFCSREERPDDRWRPPPPRHWEDDRDRPLPPERRMPSDRWGDDRSHRTEPAVNCDSRQEDLYEYKMKAYEVCAENPDGEECQKGRRAVEEMVGELEQCMQDSSPGGWDPPYLVQPPVRMPPPPPWKDGGFRTPGGPDCTFMEEEIRRMREEAAYSCEEEESEGCFRVRERIDRIGEALERCMQSGRAEDGRRLPPPYAGEDRPMPPPYVEGGTPMPPPFRGGERDESPGEMAEEQFYEIIGQARERLEGALKFVDGDTGGILEEAITALDRLEEKFRGGDRRPTRGDIEQLIERLEGVKRVVKERMHREERDDRGGDREHFDRPPPDRRPPRDVEDITQELSMVFETFIPRVFEIFEEEGESVPDAARKAYQEAYAAFQDVLPICRGGELKRRVCAAAMQEVFMILEEDMRPFIEGTMMRNDRLRARIEELFRGVEDRQAGE